MNLGILFKCDDAANVCDRSQYSESTVSERLLMKFHHVICRICREHSALNGKLSRAIKKANLQSFPEHKKRELRKVIQQEISK